VSHLAAFFWLYLGRWLAKQGMPEQAESCYRNCISSKTGNSAQAGYLLGKSLLDRGCAKQAVPAFDRALKDNCFLASAWCGLGAAHRHLADLGAARNAYDEALLLDPDLAPALSNLGELLLVQGHALEALGYFDRALKNSPHLDAALANRTVALIELGDYTAAEQAAARALELYPSRAAMHVNLGNVLFHMGKPRAAIQAFRKSIELDPACAEAHLSLSTLLGESHHLTEALDFIRQEIALKGETAQRLGTLALAQSATFDIQGAEATCRKALEIQPSLVSALITLASCLGKRGDIRGAMQLHERALKANPAMPSIYSNIAFDATYLPDATADEVFGYHREWANRFESPVVHRRFAHSSREDPGRPLRIGYVSGDFGYHPVGFLILDILRQHDRTQFQVHCFSMMRKEDDITVAIRANAFAWHDVLGLGDDQLAQEIKQQEIDILIDLSGHTAYNRLPVFALKPAPVQATWIGYFHSTGLNSIDYFITDPITSPRTCAQHFSETPVWLPDSRFCFSPPMYAPKVAPPPVLAKGFVTFGSFNRIEKLVDPVIAAWSRIVNAVPNSRLFLKAGALDSEYVRENLRDRFAIHGLAGDRIELQGSSAHVEMLKCYSEIDIALDPFPFNGGMTTLEALWMGVPVVTVVGNGIVSRQSISVLANLGLTDQLAFATAEEYVTSTAVLALDIGRLTALRHGLRGRMQESPLCRPELFVQNLETLYRAMWRAYCQGQKLPSAIE
jgi:predicted O-linked N-acetylglucosamine transferase (SPINDLY family)